MIHSSRSPRSVLGPLLAALVAWTPLPFASVTPLGELVFRSAAALLLLLAAWSGFRGSSWGGAAGIAAAPLAIAVLGWLQAVAWPRWLAALLSPQHVALADQAAAALAAAAAPGRVALSLAPAASRSAAISWLAAAALLVVASLAGRRRRGRRWIGAGLVAAAGVQVLFGLRLLAAGDPVVWGVRIAGPVDRLRGTFVNPNHLALFLELTMAVAFAWTWWAATRSRGEIPFERRLASVVAPAVVWGGLLVAVTLTGSRAGLLAVAAGLAVQASVLAASRRRWWLLAGLLLVLLAGSWTVKLVGDRGGVDRLGETSLLEDNLQSRFEVGRLAVDLWRRFPGTGSGLGTFGDAFPLVQTADLAGMTWDRAHNDPLELLVTGGVVAGLFGLAGLALVVRRLWRVLTGAHRTENVAAAVAAFGALATALVHELFDFGLTLPANACALALVVGAACGVRLNRRGSVRRG